LSYRSCSFYLLDFRLLINIINFFDCALPNLFISFIFAFSDFIFVCTIIIIEDVFTFGLQIFGSDCFGSFKVFACC